MNSDDIFQRLRNEPEWAVLIGLLVLLMIAGGSYFYLQYQSQQRSARSNFNQALNVYSRATRSGRFQQAISSLERFTRNHPEAIQADKAHFFLGKTYMRVEEYISAIKQFKQLLESHPDSLFAEAARLHIGYANLERGKVSRAINAFRILSSEHPDHPLSTEARWQQALLLLDRGKRKQAKGQLEKITNASNMKETYWADWATRLKNRLDAKS